MEYCKNGCKIITLTSKPIEDNEQLYMFHTNTSEQWQSEGVQVVQPFDSLSKKVKMYTTVTFDIEANVDYQDVSNYYYNFSAQFNYPPLPIQPPIIMEGGKPQATSVVGNRIINVTSYIKTMPGNFPARGWKLTKNTMINISNVNFTVKVHS